MRVGILTGPAVVGAIGSRERMKYATVGNTVNTASRLESFDKISFEVEPSQATWRILIGESTWSRLGGQFAATCIGAHVLKGKGEPVTIYRVLGRSRDVPSPGGADEANGR
jgi:adenylate cyclase